MKLAEAVGRRRCRRLALAGRGAAEHAPDALPPLSPASLLRYVLRFYVDVAYEHYAI